MSTYLIATPDVLGVVSADLAGIGQSITEAAAAAAPSTTGIVAAARDEISAAIATLFDDYAGEFQALNTQAAQFHADFARAVSAAGAAYAAAEAANLSPLQALKQGLMRLTQNTILRPFVAQLTGLPVPTGAPTPEGVTGVRVGFSLLEIPSGPFGYAAPARWYFPTQANGSVQANGVIYLQHGFAAIGLFYDPLAMQLAQQTNSIVVVPTLPSIPLPFISGLSGTQMQQAVGSLFLGGEPALNRSAQWAGYHGTLPSDFVLSGHSAGGGLATASAGYYLAALGGNIADNHLLGVVMFDGVSSDASVFAASIATMQAFNVPNYVVAAPPQPWNAFGVTTQQLVSLYPGQFSGVELLNGSHVDSMVGGQPVIDFFAQLLTGFSPPGNTAAVYNLATGWINDFYAGGGPANPIYGIYGPTGGYVTPGGQQIALGPATGIVLPV